MSLARPSRLALAARDISEALRFFSRAPIGRPLLTQALDLNRIAWAAPVTGALIGLAAGFVLAFSTLLGLPAFVRAALATSALVAATGALHEDGLADVADGFGGGATRARKLEIMRDSGIGAFGAAALGLALILRVAALSAALAFGFWHAAAALILVAALSRAGALTPLALLPPARTDGTGAAAGRLDPGALVAAWGAAVVIACVLGLGLFGLAHALAATIASGAAAWAMTDLARRQIGGQTGDVAGAAQQCAEIAAWCGLLACLPAA